MIFENQIPSSGEPASNDLRWQVVESLSSLLPQRKNYAEHDGQGFRKLRLERELARYDEYYQRNFLQPASFDQLYGVGQLLLCSPGSSLRSGGTLERNSLMVNSYTFAGILDRVERQLAQIRRD